MARPYADQICEADAFEFTDEDLEPDDDEFDDGNDDDEPDDLDLL